MTDSLHVLKRAECRDRWDQFVWQHPSGWFWHLNDWLDYSLVYSPRAVDASFAWARGETLLAICPLLYDEGEFAMGGEPCPMPLMSDDEMVIAGASEFKDGLRTTTHQLVMGSVDWHAKETGAGLVRFRSSPLVPTVTAVPSAGDGYRDISWTSQVLDLTQSLDVLHAAVRKSYTSLINRCPREFLLTGGNRRETDGFLFTQLYDEAYRRRDGRFEEARPPETDAIYEHWVKTGKSLAVMALDRRTRRVAGGAQFILFKGAAYYASAAYLQDNVAHGVIWSAITILKQFGYRQLEMGWHARPWDDEKAKNVAFFKTGFGGEPRLVVAVKRVF